MIHDGLRSEAKSLTACLQMRKCSLEYPYLGVWRRCLFVGNRAGRRFRPVSRHDPAMNTLNQSLSECNRMITVQACQDDYHPHDYSLVCSLRSYIWRVSERSYIYIFSNLLIYMNSLAASAFEIQVFCCSVSL